jgi:hypothetical protein
MYYTSNNVVPLCKKAGKKPFLIVNEKSGRDLIVIIKKE